MKFLPLLSSFHSPYPSNYLINNPNQQETTQINSDHSLFTSNTENIHITYKSDPKNHILLFKLSGISNNLTKNKFLPANMLPNAWGSTLAGRNFFYTQLQFLYASSINLPRL